MLLKPMLGSAMSGKFGGLVASHNSGGVYVRNLAIPTNPATAQQQAVRDALAALVSRWQTVLDDDQRAAWANFAANVPLVNRVGDSRPIPALSWYNKANVPRVQSSLAIVDDGPTIFSLADLTAPVPGAVVAGPPSTLSLAFTNTDAWATEAGGGLLVYASRALAPTINFFKGPFRFAGKVVGATPVAPTSPQVITLPFNVVAGQTFYVRTVATRADGRPSPALTFRIDV